MTGCSRDQGTGTRWPCSDVAWASVLGAQPGLCPLNRLNELPLVDETLDESGHHAFLLGIEAMSRGRVSDALTYYRIALGTQVGLGAASGWRLEAALGEAYAATLVENQRAASLVNQELLLAANAAPGAPARLMAYFLSAWQAAATGAEDIAVVRALKGAEEAHEAGSAGGELLLLHQAVRFGEAGPSARLSEIAAEHVCQYSRFASAHAQALRQRDGMRLDTVATCFSQAGMPLEALDARCHAVLALRAQGAPSAAWEVFLRAQGERRAAQRPTTPAWAGAHMRLPLTDREREVAKLTATGLTREAIARRLELTSVTVEQLTREIYHKLRVSDRQALASAMASESEA